MTKLRSAQMRTAVRITPTTGYSAWRFLQRPVGGTGSVPRVKPAGPSDPRHIFA
jgi:hypothetical protein